MNDSIFKSVNDNTIYNMTWKTILAVTLMSLFVASCGNDETDNSNDDELLSILMRNKWIMKTEEFNAYSAKELEYRQDGHCLYFRTDKEGTEITNTKILDSFGSGNKTLDRDYVHFEFKVSGNTVQLYFEKGSILLTYTNGHLEYGSIVYVPVTMNSSDYEVIDLFKPKTGKTGSCTYTYSYDLATLEISGNGPMADYEIGQQPWKDFRIGLITIDDGVTTIGDHAFSGLKYKDFLIDLPYDGKLKSIGKEAFANTLIEEVRIPKSVEIIKEAAFADCKSLETIAFMLNSNLKTIERFAFSDCNYKLELLDLPSSVETIGTYAFSGKFKRITIGSKIKSIGPYAFVSSVSSGKIDIKCETPPTADVAITNNDALWSLGVPSGSKKVYEKIKPWSNFKSIAEDANRYD